MIVGVDGNVIVIGNVDVGVDMDVDANVIVGDLVEVPDAGAR